MKEDPYKTLGVTKSATQDEIKSAYRKLAKKFHPDMNPGKKESESKFKDISAAYEMVGDAEQRAKFDRGEFDEHGSHGPGGFGGRPGPGGPRGSRQQGGGGPFYYETQQDGSKYSMDQDIFESFFGSRSGRGARGPSFDQKGQDVLYQMTVDLKDAALGAEREITIGNGKKIRVKIPPGIETGKKLRFGGLGEPGTGGAGAGDALVEIIVKDSGGFKRVGQDLESEFQVSLSEAILGAEIKVPTIDGSIMLKVPSGSNSGNRLRVKGKGVVTNANSGARGDQIVILKVVLPAVVDDDLKTAIREWSEKHPQGMTR